MSPWHYYQNNDSNNVIEGTVIAFANQSMALVRVTDANAKFLAKILKLQSH
jgi:hypothetical protein